jgi:DNA-binding CsgD family transcriptional regulator
MARSSAARASGRSGVPRRPGGPLSPREHENRLLMLRGLGVQASADIMGLSVHTVKNYRTIALRFHGVRSQAELIALLGSRYPTEAGRAGRDPHDWILYG